VSTATVSRVVNDDPRISGETRARVLEAIEKLDYKINNIARSLKTNRTSTVGFISPELSNDFFMSIAKGVEDGLRKYGYNMIICNSNESAEEETDRIRLLCQKCVDGMIIIPATGDGSHLRWLKDSDIPVVLADRLTVNFETDAVLVDNINGSYSIIEHLISKGHRRIGFIGGDLRLTPAAERFEGYRRALADYCLPYENEIARFGDFHVQGGYDLMKELMELPQPPTIVFISNHYMHVGATKYLMEHRDGIDPAFSIASFDDMELSSILGFCRIRAAQPVMEIGRRAAQLLMSRINREETGPPRILRLKSRLVTG
jgi:LacI family transcriptional regulator